MDASDKKNPASRDSLYLNKQTVYRCGHCGRIVDKNGLELEGYQREYHIALLEKYNDITQLVTGTCCKHRDH